jgi:hypothetical protein
MRLVLVSLLVAALAAVLWFSLPDSPDEAPPSPDAEPDRTAEEAAEPEPAEPAPEPDSGPGSIRGTVTRDGKPVAAEVTLRRLREDEGVRIARVLAVTRAGADGRYDFSAVSSGPREVVAVAADGARGRAFVYPSPTGIPAVVHIVIGNEALSLRVVAVYADGRPFDGEIALTGWTDGYAEKEPPYECWREDWVPADAVITLRPGAVPVLTLLDAMDNPLAGGYLRVTPAGGGKTLLMLSSVAPNAKGEYRLNGLDPEKRYRLEIWPRGELIPVTLDPWTPEDTLIRFAKALRITGTVRDASGREVAARVYHRRKGGERWIRDSSKSDGAFVLRNLPEGEYELCAAPSNGGAKTEPVVVRAGGPPVELTLR